VRSIDITIAKNLPNASPMPPDDLPMLPNGLRVGVRSGEYVRAYSKICLCENIL
jgi:hypothetical protein